MEGLRLRVKDLNFEYQSLHIHDGKGAKDRVVIFPLQLHAAIQVQLQHSGDLAQGLGQVYLPNALSRKYKSAARDWSWQYVFPSDKLLIDPRSERKDRHHLNPSTMQKAIRRAVIAAKIGGS